MSELDDLLQQQLQLQEKIRLLQEEERIRLEVESRKVVVNISKFNLQTNRVHIKLSKYDSKMVDYLRYRTQRLWDSLNEVNVVDIQSLPAFITEFTSPDVTFLWDNTIEKYEEWKNRPDMYLDVDPKRPYILVQLGPKMSGEYLGLQYEIPSFSNEIGIGYRFAIADFHLWPAAIQQRFSQKRVEYSDAAKKLLEDQLEHRRIVAELANATDYPMESPFIEGFDLAPHQRVAVRFVELSGGKAIIAYDMGLGKTAIAIGLAERHPDWKKILIICPASLKTMWKREIKKFTGHDAFVHSGISPDDMSIEALVNTRYHIINYDIIGRETGAEDDKVMPWVALLSVIQPDYIVTDECHYIKNMGSSRSKGVRALPVENITPMSGTPLVNRPFELYPNLSMVDKEAFSSPTAFFNQFCHTDGTAKNVKKLHEMAMSYMIRRTRKDVYGDKIVVTRVPITKELSPTARANYTKILQGIYISLRNPNYQTNVTSILAELMRCKQTCSADNIQASAELAMNAWEETEKKVIIFSQFKESQYGIESILGKNACTVNGDVKDEERYKLMDLFQDPKSDLKFWITNILEGLTLTEAHTVIFNDIWWTPKDHNQAEGRAFGRNNDPHGGNSYWLENENTIDQFLNELIIKKMGVFSEVVDGIRSSQESEEGIVSQLLQHLRAGI